jgi:hypothetical protein
LANECINLISNGVKPKVTTLRNNNNNNYYTTLKENELITFPDDYLSYGDFVNYYRKDVNSNWESDPEIIFVDHNQIRVSEVGDYMIFYNANWLSLPTDTEMLNDDYILNVDDSILNCLPTYIASQLLAQDDIQRSTILKNEFELLLSRLDTNDMYQQNHFRSSGGWY